MSLPLIPYTPDDARALWSLVVDEIERRVVVDPTAVRLLATECVAHTTELMRREPPGVRVVVLAAPDQQATLKLATAAADAMDLPRVVAPVTSISESGWAGRNLADWLRDLEHDSPRQPWIRRAVVVLSGLEALRVVSGAYEASSASTRDYRTGKSENIASLLRGEPVPWSTGEAMWDAQRAMVIVTTTYDQPAHDADVLADWGLLPELARLVASATWIHVPRAEGRVAEYEIWDAIEPVRRLYEVFGVLLDVSEESVRRAAMQAAARGETSAVAASWIVRPARQKLAAMLASGDVHSYVVMGPDDTVPPKLGRTTWVD